MLALTTWGLWFGRKTDINTIHTHDFFISEESVKKTEATLCIPSMKGFRVGNLRFA